MDNPGMDAPERKYNAAKPDEFCPVFNNIEHYGKSDN
jgi:hypothetical protein